MSAEWKLHAELDLIIILTVSLSLLKAKLKSYAYRLTAKDTDYEMGLKPGIPKYEALPDKIQDG